MRRKPSPCDTLRLHVLDRTPPVYLNFKRNGAVTSPEQVAPIMRLIANGAKREYFCCFYLNTRHVIRRIHVISIGSLNASIVHPREVFRPAICHSAAAIILAHNHPSADEHPSEDDIEITHRLRQVGETMGIEVLDHVIVGGSRHFSFREHGLF